MMKHSGISRRTMLKTNPLDSVCGDVRTGRAVCDGQQNNPPRCTKYAKSSASYFRENPAKTSTYGNHSVFKEQQNYNQLSLFDL